MILHSIVASYAASVIVNSLVGAWELPSSVGDGDVCVMREDCLRSMTHRVAAAPAHDTETTRCTKTAQASA